jgi:branched-chain amino acid transport system permease protein
MMKIAILASFKRISLLQLLLFVVLMFVPLLPLPLYYFHVMIYIFMWAFLALSWNILHAYLGLFSLGQPAFFGIGAYFMYFLLVWFKIYPLFGMFIAAIISLLFASFIGYISFRFGLKGIFFCLASLAAPEILYYTFVALPDITGGHIGITLPSLESNLLTLSFTGKIPYYYFIVFTFFFSVFLLQNLKKTTYFWLAIRENEDVAASVGIDTMKYKMLAFMLSAFLTSLGGSFYLLYAGYICPDTAFGFGTMMDIMVIGVLGGSHLLGPLVGATILVPAGEILRATLGGTYYGAHIIIYGTLLLLMLKYKPTGILGR